jgi:hypothetical protein
MPLTKIIVYAAAPFVGMDRACVYAAKAIKLGMRVECVSD